MPELQPRKEAHSRDRGRGKTRRATNQRMRGVWGPAQSLPAPGRCCKRSGAQTLSHLSRLQVRACLEQLSLEASGSITYLRYSVLKHVSVMVQETGEQRTCLMAVSVSRG